jgi:acyl-coenzyme A synthetase/AMP-(fatty) acid ligase
MVRARPSSYRRQMAELACVCHADPGPAHPRGHHQIVAYVVAAGTTPPDLLELKRHCAATLPRHTIIDAVRNVRDLPRTGKRKLGRGALVRAFVKEQARP